MFSLSLTDFHLRSCSCWPSIVSFSPPPIANTLWSPDLVFVSLELFVLRELLENYWQRGIIQFIICLVHSGHQTLFVCIEVLRSMSLSRLPVSGQDLFWKCPNRWDDFVKVLPIVNSSCEHTLITIYESNFKVSVTNKDKVWMPQLDGWTVLNFQLCSLDGWLEVLI